nr:uncharacterized protein LOC117225506 [Megalopta genalis]
MRICVLVLVLAAIAASCDASTNGFKLQMPLAFNVPFASDKLVSVLTTLKTWMQQGHKKPDIPILEPFQTVHMPLSVNNPFIRYFGNLDNPYITGLSNFNVKKGEYNLEDNKAVVNLKWDAIYFLAMYDVTSLQVVDWPMAYGQGAMVAVARGLEITVEVKIAKNSGNKLDVSDLKLTVSLDKLEFNASGLLGDPDESTKFSDKISAEMPQIIIDNQAKLSYYGGQALKKILDQSLLNMTYDDFIAMINT